MNPETVAPAATSGEWGEQIASFAPTRVPLLLAILNKSVGILFFFGVFAYDAENDQWLRIPLFFIGVLIALAAYRMATRHNRPEVVVYENGIWCRFRVYKKRRNFYHWDEIKGVEQIAYYHSYDAWFSPGFLISFKGESRLHAVYQTLDRYTELYRIFYQRKILNAGAPLQLFDINISGYICANAGWYTSLYYPDKNKIVQFKGRPIPSV